MSGEFEVEPAFGEKREEALRIAGLKTYFIKSVLIPVSIQNLDLDLQQNEKSKGKH